MSASAPVQASAPARAGASAVPAQARRTLTVAHFAPFAPTSCGLYEAARDFVAAEAVGGRRGLFCDLGCDLSGRHTIRPPGTEDVRRSGTLRVAGYPEAAGADLFVAHNCLPNDFLASTGQPIVFVLHGRPVDSLRPEFWRRGPNSYTIYREVAAWPRVTRLLTLWPEHAPYWEPIVPAHKLAVLAAPPVDRTLYCPGGPAHEWDPGTRGEFNVLVADSWREDDPYYIVHGAMLAARTIPGLKLHLYGAEKQRPDPASPGAPPDSGPWEHVYAHLRGLGILGEVAGRMNRFDEVLRAADVVLTHNPSASRVVAEALSCGTAVVAAAPNPFTPFAYHGQHDARAVADALVAAWEELREHGRGLDGLVAEAAEQFSFERFAAAIGRVYDEALGLAGKE